MPRVDTLEIPKRLPLFIEPANRDETTSKDARLVNCFIEKKGNDYTIYQRAGLTTSTQPSGTTGVGRGIYNWKGDIYSIVGNTLYKGTTSKGTVDTTNGVYRFSQCLGATPKLSLGNGVKAYNYDDGAGLVQITDADFPTAFVKGWAYLDGTTYVMDSSANIQGSGLNAPPTWDPLNVLVAQVEPDGGVGLAKQLVYVIAFKQWSTEVFFDAGNATGSPLGPVQGAKINYGLTSQDAVQDAGGTLLWPGTTREGAVQVLSMDGVKADIVSTKAIERLLEGWDWTSIYSWYLKHDGHRFYGLTSTVSNMTLVYDLSERMWSQWTDKDGNYWPIVSSTYTSTFGHLLQHATNGKIYSATMATTNDDGDTITVDIYTPNFDGGTKRKKQLSILALDADQAPTELLVRRNDNDYNPASWSPFRTINLASKQPMLTNCGTFRRRAYHFRHQKPNVRMPRLRAVDMQIALGSI